MAYNSAHTGATIDAAISAVKQKESAWDRVEAVAIWFTLPSSSWSSNSQAAENDLILTDGYIYMLAPNDYGIAADDITVDGQVIFRCATTPTTDVDVCLVRISEKA